MDTHIDLQASLKTVYLDFFNLKNTDTGFYSHFFEPQLPNMGNNY